VAAQFRAIEQGIPLIRVANTGVSAVIDAYGRIVHKLSLNREGIIDFDLPPALKRKTLYYYFGDLPWVFLSLMIIGLAFFKGRGDFSGKPEKLPLPPSSSKRGEKPPAGRRKSKGLSSKKKK
jgi:apolipoprotein N-acyltransferase